jgi:APA family basic amino acid/polyamine antiporter
VLAVIYIFSGTFNTLTDLLVFVLWIFFTMGVFGVFLLRKKMPPEKGRYRVPLYPVTPVIGVAGGLYILGSTIVSDPLRSLIGIGIALAGLPVYYVLSRNKA